MLWYVHTSSRLQRRTKSSKARIKPVGAGHHVLVPSVREVQGSFRWSLTPTRAVGERKCFKSSEDVLPCPATNKAMTHKLKTVRGVLFGFPQVPNDLATVYSSIKNVGKPLNCSPLPRKNISTQSSSNTSPGSFTGYLVRSAVLATEPSLQGGPTRR